VRNWTPIQIKKKKKKHTAYRVYVGNDHLHLSDIEDLEGTEPLENSIVNFNRVSI
jgi:Ca2+-dependent lipid-binding protein